MLWMEAFYQTLNVKYHEKYLIKQETHGDIICVGSFVLFLGQEDLQYASLIFLRIHVLYQLL